MIVCGVDPISAALSGVPYDKFCENGQRTSYSAGARKARGRLLGLKSI